MKKIKTTISDNDSLTKNQNNFINMSTETSSMRNGNNTKILNKSRKYSTSESSYIRTIEGNFNSAIFINEKNLIYECCR